jgi:hypothetical protein
MCTTCGSNKNVCILSTKCVHVFHVIPTANSDCFHIQHQQVGLLLWRYSVMIVRFRTVTPKLTSSSAFLCEKMIYVIRLIIISCSLQWCFSVKRMKNRKLTWNQRRVFLVLRWADSLDFLAAVVLSNMRNSLSDHIRIWQQSLKGYFMFHSFYISKDHNLFISFLSLLNVVVNI